jgi:hypothetical protein
MNKFKLVFERQIWHYLFLAALLVGIYVASRADRFFYGQLFGVGSSDWFTLAIFSAILHQVYVWFCWRTQLHYSLLTRVFGERGFTYHSIGFFVLGFIRTFLVYALAVSNRGSFHANQMLLNLTAVIITVPLVYLLYSVKKYFTVTRALGIDHFDESYRNKPFVREGIFRFTSNSMYTFGFLILWIPGLVFSSEAALTAALFNHLYIWVHYYTLEKPDIKRIYR